MATTVAQESTAVEPRTEARILDPNQLTESLLDLAQLTGKVVSNRRQAPCNERSKKAFFNCLNKRLKETWHLSDAQLFKLKELYKKAPAYAKKALEKHFEGDRMAFAYPPLPQLS